MKKIIICLLFVSIYPLVIFPQKKIDIKFTGFTTSKFDSTNFYPDASFLFFPILQNLPFRGDAQEYYALFPGLLTRIIVALIYYMCAAAATMKWHIH